jgi:hypothetical protein
MFSPTFLKGKLGPAIRSPSHGRLRPVSLFQYWAVGLVRVWSDQLEYCSSRKEESKKAILFSKTMMLSSYYRKRTKKTQLKKLSILLGLSGGDQSFPCFSVLDSSSLGETMAVQLNLNQPPWKKGVGRGKHERRVGRTEETRRRSRVRGVFCLTDGPAHGKGPIARFGAVGGALSNSFSTVACDRPCNRSRDHHYCYSILLVLSSPVNLPSAVW